MVVLRQVAALLWQTVGVVPAAELRRRARRPVLDEYFQPLCALFSVGPPRKMNENTILDGLSGIRPFLRLLLVLTMT